MATHGKSGTRLYRIYMGMKQRCYNPNSPVVSRYGGRGIGICPTWLGPNGFEHFYRWALTNGYREDLTIDRIDPDLGYSPVNCRWISLSENASRAHRGKRQKSVDIPETMKQGLSLSIERLMRSGWVLTKTVDKNVVLTKEGQTLFVPLYEELPSGIFRAWS